MNRVFTITLCVFLLTSTSFAAETLRCGGKIVKTGMTITEVERYCGKPSSSEVEDHVVRAGNRAVGTSQLHIWTYNRASGQKAAVLEFDQDVLLSIEYVRK